MDSYAQNLAILSRMSSQAGAFARSTTKRRERRSEGRFPLSRQTITLTPYSQRRCAVERAIPNRQQIAFHCAPSARAHTSLASSPSSHRSQPSASSIRLIASDDGGRRLGLGSFPLLLNKLRRQARLKTYPRLVGS